MAELRTAETAFPKPTLKSYCIDPSNEPTKSAQLHKASLSLELIGCATLIKIDFDRVAKFAY